MYSVYLTFSVKTNRHKKMTLKSCKTYFQYWGKAKKDSPKDFHLLVFHSLDVAAVGQRLLETNQALSDKFSELTGFSQKQFRRWFVFMAALHDIGKFASSFQNLNKDSRQILRQRSDSARYSSAFKHDSLGLLLWNKRLKAKLQHRNLIPKRSFFDFLTVAGWKNGAVRQQKRNYVRKKF